MKNKDFAHLHLHNEYSHLDGFGSAKDYVKRAKELGFEYLGITNHGNIDGCINFQKECKKQDIKPIIGAELYVVPDMTRKYKGEKKGHLTVLVENKNGWHTLCKWLTKANLEGYYHRPRCDFNQILESNLDGLTFMTACAGSVIRLPGGLDFVFDLWKKSERDDSVYIEIMPHDIKVQHELHKLIDEEFDDNWPFIASNDCHWVYEDEWEVQEMLLAVQRGATWNDPKRWKFGFKGLHLRTADEMLIAFSKQGDFDRKKIRQAMENTIAIAEKCSNFEIEKLDVSLPNLPYNISIDEFDHLKESCLLGLQQFGLDKKPEYRKRLEEELDLIKRKKFERYFLLVQDFVLYCKKQGWEIGPGRGSVGGSLVAYLLHITEGLDPIELDLPFSRFLSEHRIDLPDIDIDVEKRYRKLAVDYLYKTYGENSVCAISTDMRMKSKAVIHDVGRVLEVPSYEVANMANSIYETEHQERSAIIEAIEYKKEAQEFADKYPDVIDFSLALEGQIRGSGRHAAGIIISGDDLTDGKRCVLVKRKNYTTTNWSMNDAEYRGLIKLDVLGLATLSVIGYAQQLINKKDNTNFYYHPESDCYFYSSDYPGDECEEINFDITKIPMNDKDVLDLISRGTTAGLFQVSGKPLTELCRKMGIESFSHIRDANALVRPGPTESGETDNYVKRKHGERYNSIHPIYDEITSKTYGVALFQEQVMQIIAQMAGMSESDADHIRKVIGKKRDPKEFEPYKKKFIEGCEKQKTFSKKQAEDFWSGLLEWARYGLNRSHATAYALLAYRTAFLKTHYPVEFMCATLTYGEYDERKRDPNKHKQSMIDEAFDLGISVMPPKKGISQPTEWVARDKTLYAPFVEIKGIGESNAAKCVEAKEQTKVKQRGFFNIDPKPKKETQIDKILKDIQANDPDTIPSNLSDYLSFTCMKQTSKNLKRNRRSNTQTSPELSSLKIKEIGYRNEDIINCNKCQLRDEATEPVLSSIGQYNVAIILEAPGNKEDKGIETRSGGILRMGAIGPAGNTLWDGLKSYEIYRRHVHVTNICHCYPSRTRTPKDIHINACLPWLLDELQRIDCKLALACGNIAVKALTGRNGGITKISGTREWISKINSWVVWCVHPSSVLRNSKQNRPLFEKGLAEFAKAFEELENE